MVRAVVVKFRAMERVVLPPPRGHRAHALSLRAIQQIDPALSARLHDEHGYKPYTVSAAHAPVTASTGSGQSVWLRVTLLDDVLFVPFYTQLAGQPSSLRLGSVALSVEDLFTTWEQHSLAGATTSESLLGGPACEPGVDIAFLSPTAFSLGQLPEAGRRMCLLPEPVLVFNSLLLRRWNMFAPPDLQLDPSWRQVFEGFFTAGSFSPRTVSFSLPRHAQFGFLGHCRFQALSGEPQFRHVFHALVRFAPFAGVGYKTTMAMGQVRLFPHESRPSTITDAGRAAVARA